MDKDGDGLDDALEERLLDKYRPYLFFDQDEFRWPSSITDFVRACSLFYLGSPGIPGREVYGQERLAADPLLALRGDDAFSAAGASSWADRPEKTPWAIAQADPSGNFGVFPGADGSNHRGTYGHAMPTKDGRILVQYWQFFPFNDGALMEGAQNFICSDGGNHEGDWVWMDVLLANQPPNYPIQEIWYHHHGDNNCAPIMVTRSGDSDAPIRIYVEGGNHEFWPNASDGFECSFCGKKLGIKHCAYVAAHRGDGISYRVPSVLNVGEVYAPMPGSVESDLFILFNGTWGKWAFECEPFDSGTPADPPLGQATASLGNEKSAFPAPPPLVRCVDPRTTVRTGHGTPRFPYKRLSDAAIGVNSVQAHGTVRLRPGVYSEPVKISKPMTIRRWED